MLCIILTCTNGFHSLELRVANSNNVHYEVHRTLKPFSSTHSSRGKYLNEKLLRITAVTDSLRLGAISQVLALDC